MIRKILNHSFEQNGNRISSEVVKNSIRFQSIDPWLERAKTKPRLRSALFRSVVVPSETEPFKISGISRLSIEAERSQPHMLLLSTAILRPKSSIHCPCA